MFFVSARSGFIAVDPVILLEIHRLRLWRGDRKSRTEEFMLKRVSLMAAAAALLLASGYAKSPNQPKDDHVVISVDRVNPTDGKQMYSSYCAPCHGTDGRGTGPVAGALKSPPTDLTTLAKTHNGKYPDSHVVAVLQFGSELAAHGTVQMPVWGPVLGKISSNVNKTTESQLRIANLSRYLQSIQAK
jgi:mono/diheme cytochrome c family protein